MVWIVSARNASLADYMTMVSFMAKDFVTEAFATYCHRNGGLLQLCFLLNEDVDVAKWFPIYSVEYCEWEGKCDQPVTIDGCMLLGMSTCDLIHTKNLKNMRSRLAVRLGLVLDVTIVVDDVSDIIGDEIIVNENIK